MNNAIAAGGGLVVGPGQLGQQLVINPQGYGVAQMSAAQNGYQDKTMAEQVGDMHKKLVAQAKVLEYIQAQLNLSLFKGDPLATDMFSAGMSAAVREVVNRK